MGKYQNLLINCLSIYAELCNLPVPGDCGCKLLVASWVPSSILIGFTGVLDLFPVASALRILSSVASFVAFVWDHIASWFVTDSSDNALKISSSCKWSGLISFGNFELFRNGILKPAKDPAPVSV